MQILYPVQFGCAAKTTLLILLIQILHVGDCTHNADRITAMDQAVGMTQFMDDHLANAIDQQIIIGIQSIVFISQTVKGGHSSITAQTGLTENIGQNGNIQINTHHTNYLNCIGGGPHGYRCKQLIGIILSSPGIIEMTDIQTTIL